MNVSKSIRPKSLPDSVAQDLRHRILTGDLSEGDQLRQEALARYYEISRMPVREALRQLEAEGLVHLYPHRGAVVRGLSLQEIHEVFHLRALIECDLLRQAIPKMKTEAIATAQQGCAEFDEVVEGGRDLEDWGALNWKIHSALYAPSECRQGLQIASNLHNQADRYLRLQLLLTAGETRASSEHRRLVALAQAGAVEEAVTLLHDHIRDAGEDLVAFLTRKMAPVGAGRPEMGEN